MTLSGRIPCTTDPAARCVGMEAVEIQGHIHVHQIAVFQGSQVLKTELGVSKNRGKNPKMDGENNGKPYENGMIWGENPTIFGNYNEKDTETEDPQPQQPTTTNDDNSMSYSLCFCCK